MTSSGLGSVLCISPGCVRLRSGDAIGPGIAIVEYVCDDPEGIGLFGYSHLELYVNGGGGSGQDPKVADKSLSALEIVPEADTWTQVSIPASSRVC